MTFSVITSALAAAVATNGTFTASYPSGKDAGNFFLAMGHVLVVNGAPFYFPVDFDVTLGASSITITNKNAATWPAGATTRLQMEEMGDRVQVSVPLQSPNAQSGTIGTSLSQSINTRARLQPSTTQMYCDLVTLGAPTAAAANNICLSQSAAASGALLVNGALATSGVATLDNPRALQLVSTGADTAIVTVTGTDVYGRAMSEAITLNGATVVNGLKAFKTITAAATSAAIANLMTLGTTDTLGIPVFVPNDGFVIAELRNGIAVGGVGTQTIPFVISQVDLLASTSQSFVSPVDGFITGAKVVVNKNTNVTQGTIQIKVGTTNVAGLAVNVAASNPGAVTSATPTTPFSATTVVTAGSRIQVTPSSFTTSGDVTGYVEVSGTQGILTQGIRTAGGSTTTTGDTRGTYKPSIACDGAAVIQLIVCFTDRYSGIAQNVAGA